MDGSLVLVCGVWKRGWCLWCSDSLSVARGKRSPGRKQTPSSELLDLGSFYAECDFHPSSAGLRATLTVSCVHGFLNTLRLCLGYVCLTELMCFTSVCVCMVFFHLCEFCLKQHLRNFVVGTTQVNKQQVPHLHPASWVMQCLNCREVTVDTG